jgi:hypothetical protein
LRPGSTLATAQQATEKIFKPCHDSSNIKKIAIEVI